MTTDDELRLLFADEIAFVDRIAADLIAAELESSSDPTTLLRRLTKPGFNAEMPRA